MPQSAKKPCSHPGCGVLVHGKQRYCKLHHKDESNYRHTKTSSQRGYGSKWQKLRLIALKRDNYLCQICLKIGCITHANVVDHIKPKAKGGDDSMDNLQSLCKPCHDYKTATEDSK